MKSLKELLIIKPSYFLPLEYWVIARDIKHDHFVTFIDDKKIAALLAYRLENS